MSKIPKLGSNCRRAWYSAYFGCECTSREHLIELTLDAYDPKDIAFCVSVRMNQSRSFFSRFWIAVKYLFKCRHKDEDYHWDSVMLKIEDSDRMIKMLQEYKRLSTL